MKLEHIGITINEKSEIQDFYVNILGMKVIREFVLVKKLALQLFNIEKDVPVFLLEKNNVTLELFIINNKVAPIFNHFCFSVENRDEIYNKSVVSRYKNYRKKREFSDLIFIYDKAGNIFELKDKK